MPKAKRTDKETKTLRLLKNWIIGLSIFQIMMYLWAAWITIQVSNNLISGWEGLGGILPAGLYVFAGLINVILVLCYGFKAKGHNIAISRLVIGIVVIMITLTVLAPQILEYVYSIDLVK